MPSDTLLNISSSKLVEKINSSEHLNFVLSCLENVPKKKDRNRLIWKEVLSLMFHQNPTACLDKIKQLISFGLPFDTQDYLTGEYGDYPKWLPASFLNQYNKYSVTRMDYLWFLVQICSDPRFSDRSGSVPLEPEITDTTHHPVGIYMAKFRRAARFRGGDEKACEVVEPFAIDVGRFLLPPFPPDTYPYNAEFATSEASHYKRCQPVVADLMHAVLHKNRAQLSRLLANIMGQVREVSSDSDEQRRSKSDVKSKIIQALVFTVELNDFVGFTCFLKERQFMSFCCEYGFYHAFSQVADLDTQTRFLDFFNKMYTETPLLRWETIETDAFHNAFHIIMSLGCSPYCDDSLQERLSNMLKQILQVSKFPSMGDDLKHTQIGEDKDIWCTVINACRTVDGEPLLKDTEKPTTYGECQAMLDASPFFQEALAFHTATAACPAFSSIEP